MGIKAPYPPRPTPLRVPMTLGPPLRLMDKKFGMTHNKEYTIIPIV